VPESVTLEAPVRTADSESSDGPSIPDLPYFGAYDIILIEQYLYGSIVDYQKYQKYSHPFSHIFTFIIKYKT
jgi:hypothetical protein